MKILMVGVDRTSLGGMLTVVENYLNDKEFCEKTQLIYVPITTHASRIRKLLFALNAYQMIKRIIIEDKVDLVHIHMSDGGSAFREGLILKTAKKLGCKTIAHMHAADYESWYYRQPVIINKIVSKLLQYADVIFALGKEWEQTYRIVTHGKTEVRVLYNAVSVPEFNEYNIESNNILFLAHMIKRKGIDDLLDAVVLIKDKIPENIKFVLYGADRETNIHDRIEVRNLQRNVEYRGWLSGEDKLKFLKDTRINILPSYHEGLPMTILETMAYGIPNITTNIAAIPEAIESDLNGILIEPGDVEKLGASIVRLINDKECCSYMSENSYATAKVKFSLDVHIKQVINTYEELLNK